MSTSSFFQRSRRGLSSTESTAPATRRDDSTSKDASTSQTESSKERPDPAKKLDFMDVLNASTRLGLPSIELRGAEVADSDTERPSIVLGSGLTSNVVQYTMNADDPIETPTGRLVALKTFTRPSSSGIALQAVYKTILREMDVLRHPLIAGHPSIVQLHFIGWRKGEPFPALAMEHGTHGSLDYLIRSSWPGLDETQIHTTCGHITVDITMGLYAIHRAGFVHGDLKPENILIMSHEKEDRRVVAKLTDFGGSSPHAGQRGGRPVHFTPLWSAPEVLNKDPDIDWERADVYSFGLVIGSLWASIRESGGFGAGRLSRPSSCFLSSYYQAAMSQQDEEDMLWYMKTSLDTSMGQSIRSLLGDKLKQALPGEDDLRRQILESLAPTLQAYFWTRPRMEDVGHSLHELGRRVSRDIRQEMVAPPRQDMRSREKPKFGPFSWTRSRDYFTILVEQATLALDDRKVSDRDIVAHIDIPAILPEDFHPGKYLKRMADVVKDLAFGNKHGETAESTETRWEDKTGRAKLARFIALASLAATKSQANLKTLSEMIYTSAMAGDGAMMCFAALMFNATPREDDFPSRCFLSLLAMSQSSHAAQILYNRWPKHYKMVQDMIKAKPSAFDKTASQISPNSSPFMLETLTTYSREPLLRRSLNLKEALAMGILDVVRDIVEGRAVPDDLNQSAPKLLHGLSSLPDEEAASLVLKSLALGGNLSFEAPAGSAIAADLFFQSEAEDEKPLSPLCAALRRGKTKLALALLQLHAGPAEEPLPDFDEALILSITYLQHEVADSLIRFKHDESHLCYKTNRYSADPNIFISELALDIMNPERYPTAELERRLLFGLAFSEAYENTLKVILGLLVATTGGSLNNDLMIEALCLDDVIAMRILIEALENQGVDVMMRLKDLWNSQQKSEQDEIEITALDMCIFYDAAQTFEYLLQKFPSFASDIFPESGSTLLHEACNGKGSVAFVEALLRCGANATLKNHRGQTPLFRALSNGNIEAADAIAHHLSNEVLREHLARGNDEGWSICFQLLGPWSKVGPTGLLKSFEWLAKHDGIWSVGPKGVFSWYPVISSPRPYSNADQRLFAELVTLLLGTEGIETRIATERCDGKTILHHAVWNGHIKVVKMLLDRDIDVNIGVEYLGGELPAGIPPHLFDPSKDRPTALDIVCLKLGGLSVPSEILNAGFVEVQKWTGDLEQIRDLLIEKGATSKVFDGMMGLVLDQTYARQPSRFSTSTYMHGGQAMTGAWPRPLADQAAAATPKKTDLDILADEELREEVFHNVVRSQLLKREMARRREREKELTPDDYLPKIRTGAKLRRHEWRLPPGWHCLSINEDDEDDSKDLRVMYMDRKTGMATYQRPELYRGDPGLVQHPAAVVDSPKTPDTTHSPTSSEPDLAGLDLDDPGSPPASVPSTGQRDDHAVPGLPSSISMSDDFFTATTKRGLIQLPRNYMNLTLDDGSNWLHMAAIGGKEDFVVSMLEQKLIPIDSERNDGCTPLHAAVDEGALEVLKLFLMYGADANRLFPRRGHRPLHHSLLQENTEMARILLEGGADVNATTIQGYAPLHFCIGTGGKPDFIDLLLNAGADINATSREGTALLMAVSYGQERSVAKLLDAGAQIKDNENLLQAAAQKGNIEIAKRLLDAGLDVNKRAEGQWTPIIAAVVYEHFEMLRLLCEHGADISVLVEEFRFFVRRRDDGNIDRMAMHVGKEGQDLTAETLNEGMPEEERGWEVWEPVRVTKAKAKEEREQGEEGMAEDVTE
ncbi:hypothetical protein F4778DRAFT_41758 [Xylariomycetidae sp. FL2044]|nr:hypothetical protein F4778DRAFT_41758 [Xylariomycetidae sp. FL2044]